MTMQAPLLHDFYSIDKIQLDAESIEAQVTFHIEHPIFKGHFPDVPIVPGVCQTQMLGEVLSHGVDFDLLLHSASSIKFLAVVNPTVNKSLNMYIHYAIQDGDIYAVTAIYKWQDQSFFKFKGTYKSVS